MKCKARLFISLLILIPGSIFNIFFSTALHFILSKQTSIIKMIPIKQCISSIVTQRQHTVLFLCLEGFIFLLSTLYFTINNKPYQSQLRTITPQIKTPVPAGQKQHGSAEWLHEKEKDKVFETAEIKFRDGFIKNLISQGQREAAQTPKRVVEASNNTHERGIQSEEGKKESIAEPNESQEQQYLNDGGIVLGVKKQALRERVFYVGDDVHTLCIGATRSGKSRTVVIQSLCLLGLAGESMIISDPKGELWSYTAPFLDRLGYEVITIDFKNPLKSQCYNFLQPIIDAVDRNDIAKAIDATWDLTAALVGEPKGERIWTDGEASIIASAIMSVVYDNREAKNRKYQNLTNVYFFIAEMCKTINNKMPIIEYVKTLDNGHPAKALLAISEVAPSRTRGSFYTAALTTLRLFTNPLIYSMTCSSDYKPKTISEKKVALFIILPDEKTTYYTIASLLVSQHYELLVNAADERGGRLKNRVNFMLDEFGNFAAIPSFANKLTVGGGRGIRFNLFLQSFSQLDEKYDKEVSKTIKGNCQTWIYLQSDDLETLEEMSKKLGNYTVSTYSLSSSHQKFINPSNSHSINLTGRALLTVDEVRLISRPYSLVTSRSNPAIMFSPDLSNWCFNKMLGLGDKEHNRMVREQREKSRPVKAVSATEIQLWNIWQEFLEKCEQQEEQIHNQIPVVYPTNAGRLKVQREELFMNNLQDLK